MELLGSDGLSFCTLPSLLSGRATHSQDGLISCGGGGGWRSSENRKTCSTFKDGAWVESHNLTELRYQHVSWETSEGVFMIGGADSQSKNTTEIITSNSTYFSLPYDTRYDKVQCRCR